MSQVSDTCATSSTLFNGRSRRSHESRLRSVGAQRARPPEQPEGGVCTMCTHVSPLNSGGSAVTQARFNQIALWVVGFIVAIMFLSLFSSCNRTEYQQAPMVQQQVQPMAVAAPVVIQQAAPSHDGFLTGMLMGHLMTPSARPHYSSPAPIIHQTTINKTVVQRPINTYRPPQSSYRYSAPSRSFSRGR